MDFVGDLYLFICAYSTSLVEFQGPGRQETALSFAFITLESGSSYLYVMGT